MVDDCLVCLIFMHRLEVAAEEPDERVEPHEGLHALEQQEVVGVSQADMLLLVGEDILTTALIVLHAHDDVAEDAEGRYVVVVQDDGVAL